MILTDTHTHLYLEEFAGDRDMVIQKAIESGVQYMLLPNIDSESIEPMKKLCNQYPDNCLPMMGLHPTSVKENYEDELKIVKHELDTHKYYAVGEIGIDLYWDKTHFKQQQIALRTQIEWAIEKDLPVVIHSRDSFEEIFEILDEMKTPKLRGVFHCFTGNDQHAEHILSYENFKFGIGGVLTFKNSGLDKVVANFGMENIILETDSPYLTPMPYRGKRNQSAYTYYIAEKLAEIYDISVERVAEVTTANARKLFNF